MSGVGEGASTGTLSGRRYLAVEILAVMGLLYLPALWAVIWPVIAPRLQEPNISDPVSGLISFAGRFAILLFLMAGAQGGLAHFGIDRFRLRHIPATGITFIAAFAAGMIVAGLCLWSAGPARTGQGHGSILGPIGWYLAFTVPVSTAWQELLLRGYLVTRLVDLWGSKGQAVFTAAVLSGLWAMRYGEWAMLLALAFGIVCGVCFLRFRSAWPVILASALLNVLLSGAGLHHIQRQGLHALHL